MQWERAVRDGEDDLEAARQVELERSTEIDCVLHAIEVQKGHFDTKRQEIDKMEDEIEKVSFFNGTYCNSMRM